MAVQRKVNDVRMGAQELCLQFLAVWHFYDWNTGEFGTYPGLMKMMDQTILDLNEMPQQVLKDLCRQFRFVDVSSALGVEAGNPKALVSQNRIETAHGEDFFIDYPNAGAGGKV